MEACKGNDSLDSIERFVANTDICLADFEPNGKVQQVLNAGAQEAKYLENAYSQAAPRTEQQQLMQECGMKSTLDMVDCVEATRGCEETIAIAYQSPGVSKTLASKLVQPLLRATLPRPVSIFRRNQKQAIDFAAKVYNGVTDLPEGVVPKALLNRIEEVSQENMRSLEGPEKSMGCHVASAATLSIKNREVLQKIRTELQDSENATARELAKEADGVILTWKHVLVGAGIVALVVGVVAFAGATGGAGSGVAAGVTVALAQASK